MNQWLQFILDLIKKVGPDAELKKLEAEVLRKPEDLRLKLRLGKIYFSKKNVRRGIALYREVAEQYVQDDFTLKAIALYREILKYSPGAVDCHENLADLLNKMNMSSEAADEYQVVMHFYAARGKTPEAIAAGQKLLQVAPLRFENRIRMAELYFNAGKESESLREYMRVGRQLRQDLSHLKILVEVYEKVLAKKPEELGMLRDLCVFYLKLKNPQRAIKKIEHLNLQEDAKFQAVYQKALEMQQQEKHPKK